MADAYQVTYIGADNNTHTTMAEERALYLKLFAGEVLKAFPEYTQFADKHRVKKPLAGGKSAQFPLIGRMPAAEYHTPGNEITGQDVSFAEKEISVDRLLISHLFVDALDEKMAHFETRGELSTNMARRLAQTYDNHISRELILAAQATTPITGDTTMGGTVVTDADLASATAATKMAAWEDALFGARETFDNKYVDDGTIWCAVAPGDYYFLMRQAMSNGYSVLDKRIGGNGSIVSANLPMIAGIELMSSPFLPTADYSGETFHAVDATNTVGLIWTAGAVGTVKVFDIGVETDYQIQRQGTIMVAKQAMGHGVLQGECAQHLRTAAP